MSVALHSLDGGGRFGELLIYAASLLIDDCISVTASFLFALMIRRASGESVTQAGKLIFLT